MTKHVRIENADPSDHKVRVYIEDRKADGTWVRVADALGTPISTALDYPTAMTTLTVFGGRRLVIEEA